MSTKRQKKKRAKVLQTCALCGKPLPAQHNARVVGKTGRGVCWACLQISNRLLVPPNVHMPNRAPSSSAYPDVLTPRQLIAELDKAIIGQARAKQAIAVVLWKQQLRTKGLTLPNPGLLLHGPTGCGKTALAREAAKAVGLPFLCYDATTLSEAGYKGNDAADIVRTLIAQYGETAAETAVVFLDEIDKLAAKGNDTRVQYNRGTQHSLLKLIEGTEIDGVPTDQMLFLFSGAFTGVSKTVNPVIGFDRISSAADQTGELLPSDFIAFGMEPELMGRISRCVSLEPLTAEDLRKVLLESSLSHFRSYQSFFSLSGNELSLDADAETALIQGALLRGLGARGLNALVEEWIEPKLMELAEVSR